MSLQDLETVLSGLLAPDSAVIRQAEEQLKEPFKDPGIVSALVEILAQSQAPQIRQLASVLLRRLLGKHWEDVQADMKMRVKLALLQQLSKETIHSVSFNIADLIGEIADLELVDEAGWPGLWEFLRNSFQSPDLAQQELGLMLLCTLSQNAGDKLCDQFNTFSPLFVTCLKSESVNLLYYALKCLAGLAPYVAHMHEAYFREVTPLCLGALDRLLAVDEDKSLEAMEVITELIGSEGNTIGGNLKLLLEFILRVGADQARDKAPRCKALALLLDLILTKKGKFLKGDKFLQVIQTLFAVMASPMEDADEDDDDSDLLLGFTPQAVASQVMGNLAIEFTHSMIIDPLMVIVRANHASTDENVRRACLVALTVVADGCSVHLKLNHLAPILQLVNAGFNDSSRTVFLASLSAMSEFAVHFQPDISQHTSEILTRVLMMLVSVLEEPEFDKVKTKHVFRAFEMVIENTEEDVSSFLQKVMEILMTVLSKTENTDVRELTIQSLGAVATAVKGGISPYFEQMMMAIKPHLVAPAPNESPSVMLLTCIDTLGVLARNVDKAVFQPLALDCINLGLQLISVTNDPDLRSVVFGLLSATCVACPDVFMPFLPTIIPLMWAALKESEEETADDSFAFSGLNGASNGGEEDDSDGIEGVNSPLYLLKEDGANSLAQISESLVSSFAMYFDDSFTLISQLLDDPFAPTNVERASVSCMGRLCASYKKHIDNGDVPEGGHQLNLYVAVTLNRAANLAKDTYNRLSAVAALEAIKELLVELEGVALPSDEHFTVIIGVVDEFLNLKAVCQQSSCDEEDGVEEKGTEYDHLVVETAGEILPPLAAAKGGAEFIPYITQLLPSILARTAKDCTDAERSFGYGIVAEVLKELAEHGQVFAQPLLPILVNGCSDTDDEVANNAIYGIGLLCQYGGAEVKTHFSSILQILSTALEQRKDEQRVIDNICSCVCRVLMAGLDILPGSLVLGTLLPHLPIQLDFQENQNVYVECLGRLIEANHPAIAEHRVTIAQLFQTVLSDVEKYELDKGTPPLVEAVTRSFQQLQ
ncbi:importin-4-like [Sycon ciliatum]|uniref:importin-4-like n=1 Tax=Sycon ciliatum TaxID=27933 RepID=UPI0020AB709B|eukprot:scpid27573/ scgid35544/ Importin-4; Importin-4a; Ran-binding protein 4